MKIYIVGSPGTGKTSLSISLYKTMKDSKLFEVNELMKKLKLFNGYDNERLVSTYDPYDVVSFLEKYLEDHPSFILVGPPIPFTSITWTCIIVLICTKSVILKNRLIKRHYSQEKIQENIEAELVGEILGTTMDWLSPCGPILTLDSCDKSIPNLTNEIRKFIQNGLVT